MHSQCLRTAFFQDMACGGFAKRARGRSPSGESVLTPTPSRPHRRWPRQKHAFNDATTTLALSLAVMDANWLGQGRSGGPRRNTRMLWYL